MAYSNNNAGYHYQTPPPYQHTTRAYGPRPPVNSSFAFAPPQVQIQHNSVRYYQNSPPPQAAATYYGHQQIPTPMQNQVSGKYGYSLSSQHTQQYSGESSTAYVTPLQPPPMLPPELVQYISFSTPPLGPNFSSPPPHPPLPSDNGPNYTPNTNVVPVQQYQVQQPSSQPYSPVSTTPAACPQYPTSLTSYVTTAQSMGPHQPAPRTENAEYRWAKSSQDAQAQAARIKSASRGEFPFVAVPVNPQELNRISESVQLAKLASEEVGKKHAIKLMEANGFIQPSLPMELKQLFEPLYCKLCTIVLSSNVVARDHYVGKKHLRKIEQWLQDHHISPNTIGPTGANAMPVGPREIPGTVKNADAMFQQQKRETMKRCFGGDAGPSGWTEPVPKKLKQQQYPIKKKTPGGGPNFGYCEVCKVTLTSQAHSDQHYNGKNHMAKLKKHNGDWHDRTFGIGKSFNQPKAETETESGAGPSHAHTPGEG